MSSRAALRWMALTYLVAGIAIMGCGARGAQTIASDREVALPLVASVGRTVHMAADAFIDLPQTPEQAVAFKEALEALIANNMERANDSASKAGYRIQRVEQAGRGYIIMQETRSPVVGPTIYLATAPTRDIILSTPHPVLDRLTDIESAIALPRLGARALILAGASRCAALRKSRCSGRTSICGSRERYRVSDGAHHTASLFHIAHTILAQRWPQSLVVQLHGFSRRDTSAWAVISDGSFAKRPQGLDVAEQIRDRIRNRLGAENKAVSCQDPRDERFSFRALCARTNVQGRMLNGSPNACATSTQTASGRFLHIEQSWELRQPFKAHWNEIDRHPQALAVIDALAEAVPCNLAPCDSASAHQ